MPTGTDKHFLLARAGYRCEYCKSALTDYQVEHIIPVSIGGSDEPSNLAASCPRCNRNKGDLITAPDPYTWVAAPLFNPRADTWSDHFRQSHMEVVGLTPVGRASARILFRSTSQTLSQDLHWDKIVGFKDNFTVYQHLNNLRNWRLQNRFEWVLPELERLPELLQLSGDIHDKFCQGENGDFP